MLYLSYRVSASHHAGHSNLGSSFSWTPLHLDPTMPTARSKPILEVASPTVVPHLQRGTTTEPLKEAGVPLTTEAGMTTFPEVSTTGGWFNGK